jgi:4-methylaminobutanoate oxidase (formaldehyde-forming)
MSEETRGLVIQAGDSPLPESARVVIVGGGIIGCSVAYHLTQLGWDEVVLLEQARLAGGTTWHAAGLVGQLRTSISMTRINKYSVELYQKLEAEAGLPTGWNEVGSLVLGKSETRMTQLRRTTAMAELFGVEAAMITADEARERWPLIRSDDLIGAVWLPHDGKVVPEKVALALATVARGRGAEIHEGVRVNDILSEDGKVRGVATDTGEIRADYVVLCGGMWTRDLGLRCGVDIPLYPVEHHYIVSEPIDGVHDNLPVCRDPDHDIYFRSEQEGVMLGAFQRFSKPWMVDRIPGDFSFQLLEPDWEKFEEPLRAGKWRIPALEEAEFVKFVNGPESFTPDNNFIMGEAPKVRQLFVAAGFNSVGIASAGGAGKFLSEWMTEGQATIDLWSVDIRRFMPFHNNRRFLRDRVGEVLGLHYRTAWPNCELETGRNLKRSPLHDRLAAAGACFGQKMGLERPNWFATEGMEAKTEYSFGRQNWFEASGTEHRAARESVAVFDQTSFSKFIVKGRDSTEVLQRLCGADVDVAIGKTVYTGLFNERGGYESDLTLVRIAYDEFYIVTSSQQTLRDLNWIEQNTPDSADTSIVDVTTGTGVIGVMGPRSRELLSRVSDARLSNDAFPFGTARHIGIGMATALAIRITYVGELGWELHIPVDMMATVYDELMASGSDMGITNAGHYAINSLRLEKGYRAWGHELTPDDNPFEAGLSFVLAWDKPVDFLGKAALAELRGGKPDKRMVTFVLKDPDPMLWGSEPIRRDGKVVGYTTSGAYGYSLGGAVAMGYVNNPDGVDAGFIHSGEFEIVVDGCAVPASAHLRPPYDPERKRIMA